MKFFQLKRRGRLSQPDNLVHATAVGVRYGSAHDEVLMLTINKRSGTIYLQGQKPFTIKAHASTNLEIIPDDDGEPPSMMGSMV